MTESTLSDHWHPATRALHVGHAPEQHHRSAAVPIYQSTSFVFDDAAHARSLFNLEQEGYLYSRTGNPTLNALELRIAALEARYLAYIDLMADAGYRNLICFSGNRNGMDPEQGLINAEAGLKRILGHAEKRGVMVMMELLNSKVNHPDYLYDHTEWGRGLVRTARLTQLQAALR